jgi:hypothetical protein
MVVAAGMLGFRFDCTHFLALDNAVKCGRSRSTTAQLTPLSSIPARVKKLVAAGNRNSWRGWGPMPGQGNR